VSGAKWALYAEFTARPGLEAELRSALRRHADTVRAEPGNEVFEAHCHTSDPAEFFVYEVYRDEAAFNEHLSSPASADFNARLQHLITTPQSKLTLLEDV
jgi:quinol monooxygenase YgiN